MEQEQETQIGEDVQVSEPTPKEPTQQRNLTIVASVILVIIIGVVAYFIIIGGGEAPIEEVSQEIQVEEQGE